MSMRKYLRAIARAKMKADGIERINKKMHIIGKDGRPTGRYISYMSSHWRIYADMPLEKIMKPKRPHGKRHKSFMERGALT